MGSCISVSLHGDKQAGVKFRSLIGPLLSHVSDGYRVAAGLHWCW